MGIEDSMHTVPRVTFNDFAKVVLHYCGNQRFSGYQIKFCFKEIATNLETADKVTLEGAYIPLKAFKDRFYPGRAWAPKYEDSITR